MATTINLKRTVIKYYYLVDFNKEFSNVLLPQSKIPSRFPKIIFKQDFIKNHFQSKTMESCNDIFNCCTKELGYHICTCEECSEKYFGYNSCHNRHCPMCKIYKCKKNVSNNFSF